MCESNVYIKRQGKEELVMENVAAISPTWRKQISPQGTLG